jgi:hypothetical protein
MKITKRQLKRLIKEVMEVDPDYAPEARFEDIFEYINDEDLQYWLSQRKRG